MQLIAVYFIVRARLRCEEVTETIWDRLIIVPMAVDTVKIVLLMMGVCAARNMNCGLAEKWISLHVVASVGCSVEYCDARNNKYKIRSLPCLQQRAVGTSHETYIFSLTRSYLPPFTSVLMFLHPRCRGLNDFVDIPHRRP